MLCRRAEMLPIECIVRGYLTGLGLEGVPHAAARCTARRCPRACSSRDRLPEPVFTPSTKAEVGGHDKNISFDEAVELVGGELAEHGARPLARRCTAAAPAWRPSAGSSSPTPSSSSGLIDGELVLADEVLTPDSSRFWPADQWVPGTTPPSFDKQPVRDYLDDLDWDKQPPPPAAARRGRRRRRARATSRPTSASPAVRFGTGPVWESGDMTFDVQVEVQLKAGVSDPQGATIERALPALGFDGIGDVSVGKSIRFQIDADRRGGGPRRGRRRTVDADQHTGPGRRTRSS